MKINQYETAFGGHRKNVAEVEILVNVTGEVELAGEFGNLLSQGAPLRRAQIPDVVIGLNSAACTTRVSPRQISS